MPRSIRVIKIDPHKHTYVTVMISGGNSLVRPVQRMIRAKQLGWRELCTIEDTRLLCTRPKSDGPGTETYDAGPTPLIATCDAQAEEGQPGWRMRGGPSTAGMALLFGKGINGGMIDCPVDSAWLDRHLVWLTAEEADADDPVCINHPDRPVRDTLDGDALCQECCDQWARGEGIAAQERTHDSTSAVDD